MDTVFETSKSRGRGEGGQRWKANGSHYIVSDDGGDNGDGDDERLTDISSRPHGENGG